MIAIGNSGHRSLIGAARQGIEAESPLVRAMAVWAFGRLAAAHDVKAAALRFAPEERDAGVLEEWKITLSAPAER
jgi:epoxyqueuosine reductase